MWSSTVGHNALNIYDLNRPVCIYGYEPVIGSKSDELKEVKWIINSLNSQLYSINDRKANNNDSKYLDSYDKEGDHRNKQRSKKVDPALTRKRGTNERQRN